MGKGRGVVSRIVRGCGYLPGYGSHPGAAYVAIMVGAGFVAGLHRSWIGGPIGAAVMLTFFGPMYLYGAYSRARDFDRSQSRLSSLQPAGEG